MAAAGPMNQEPLPDGNAERAKQAARESASWLRDEAGRLYTNYSKQTKFFKWRSWIVGGFVVVTLASLAAAAPPINTIDARVIPSYDSDNRFIVSVENESAENWTDVQLILDGDYAFRKDTVPAGESVLAPIAQFTRVGDKAAKAPTTLQPRRLVVSTDQGSFKAKIAAE